METTWGTVQSLSPSFAVRISGDTVNTPIQLSNGETWIVGDKVALIKIGTRWWVAGKIVPS